MEFIIVNNEIVKKEEANLTNLFWGNPLILSQKIWFGFGGIPMIWENLENLETQMEILKSRLPSFFESRRELFRIVKRMLNKNKFYRTGIIDVQIIVQNSEINFIISAVPNENMEFPKIEKGLLLDFANQKKEVSGEYSTFPAFNRGLWTILEARRRDTKYQNAIILNTNNIVCECINANLFMLKENSLITPSLETGCNNNVLRNVVLERASSLGFAIVESSKIKKEIIFQMDELFIVSEEFGFQWIMGVDKKRYVYNYFSQIHKSVNEFLKGKVE